MAERIPRPSYVSSRVSPTSYSKVDCAHVGSTVIRDDLIVYSHRSSQTLYYIEYFYVLHSLYIICRSLEAFYGGVLASNT